LAPNPYLSFFSDGRGRIRNKKERACNFTWEEEISSASNSSQEGEE
ncbi:unnamed protein product, partial [Brassica oleracea var. botrytis]